MEYRTLGSTGIEVSRIAFGAGPVSQLLTGDNSRLQRETIAAALEMGVNWFDTAATYGDGRSEANLGAALGECAAEHAHVATKVRVMPHELSDIRGTIERSVVASLGRLRRERVTLLQLHNSVTRQAGAQPTSLAVEHVLGPGGVLETMLNLQRQQLVTHLGLTGLGEVDALATVIDTGAWATIQIPYNLLNPSAGQVMPETFADTNYGDLITRCAARGMGTFAIRVLAGGAIADQPPSPHTLKTPFFPLELFERDRVHAQSLGALLPAGMSPSEAAIRYVLNHRAITSSLLGFGNPRQVAEIVEYAGRGPLDGGLWARLNSKALLFN